MTSVNLEPFVSDCPYASLEIGADHDSCGYDDMCEPALVGWYDSNCGFALEKSQGSGMSGDNVFFLECVFATQHITGAHIRIGNYTRTVNGPSTAACRA